MNLNHLTVHDMCKLPVRRCNWMHGPELKFTIHRVVGETPTQLKFATFKVRKSDGRVLGTDKIIHVTEATPADIEQYKQERDAQLAYMCVYREVSEYTRGDLHKHGFNTAQLEFLADAWKQAALMGTQPTTTKE